MRGAVTRGRAALLVVFSCSAIAADPDHAERLTDYGVAIVRLTDTVRDVRVSAVPSMGNRAYEMKVHRKDIIYAPFAYAGEFAARPRPAGIPFLRSVGGPARRAGLLGEGNVGGNVGGNMPGHGLLVTSPHWEAVEVAADSRSAHVTSRLRFWKHPDLAGQWPFAHEYEMQYSLSHGVLEVDNRDESERRGHAARDRLPSVLPDSRHSAR